MDADLVLEGGGVKGIGLAGAYSILKETGYTFHRVAGTPRKGHGRGEFRLDANDARLRPPAGCHDCRSANADEIVLGGIIHDGVTADSRV